LLTTPSAPAAVFTSGSNNAINVRWLPSFGATGYNVLRSTISGGGYAPIASNLPASTTSYEDTTAAVGTTYYYVVQAVNSAGTSGNSPQFYGSLLPSPMVNLAFGGTATASSCTQAKESPDHAFDLNPATKWFATAATGWLQYDFGANNTQVIKRYTISSADVPARDPRNWTLLGSLDGSRWRTLDSQSNQSFRNPLWQNTYNLSNTTRFRYYRLNITAANGATQVAISELGLWSDTGRTIPDGTCCLVNRYSNKLLTALNGGTANGTQLVQWTYDDGDEQKWTFTCLGNGQYKITGLASGRVMGVNGASTANGTKILLLEPTQTSNRRWTITPIGDGYFRITSAHSGKVADVEGSSTADGANLYQWAYGGVLNQHWFFTTAP